MYQKIFWYWNKWTEPSITNTTYNIINPKKKNKRKGKFEQLKREVLNEFDTLERNHEDISPQKIKKELKKSIYKYKNK